jgi:hypothetical protein
MESSTVGVACIVAGGPHGETGARVTKVEHALKRSAATILSVAAVRRARSERDVLDLRGPASLA